MSQKINLNASPYYDDFDNQKNFHRVLYKPGFPVQARELTQQQSILQNQIEKFGDHVFKEGSVVIPGGIGFDTQYNAVKLNNTNFNVDISVYINNFIGKRIFGSESGIEAVVKFIAFPDGNDVENITLFVTYLSADNDSEFNSFTDGETLSATENVVYGNTTINANTPFASLVSEDATAIGSAAFISQGVYFVRGFFVNVSDQTIILDNYSNTPSYRVGLQVNELIVNAKEDESLYDNAKGFTNFAAPGADRLNIELILTKKLLTDKNDTDFIELLRLDEGILKVIQPKSQYNKIRDWIADRTYDESGDYSVEPFKMNLFNSLNDNLGNGGLFFEDDSTDQENTPSDDLACLKISSGEAYVRGYDVEKIGTTIIDVDKPRDVGIGSDIGVGFEMGNILKLNNVTQGLAVQGSVIRLFDNFSSTGTNIGSARIYSFNLEDAAYEDASTRWELRLFDIQTNTDLVLNKTISNTNLPAGSFVKGKNSGASGFAVGSGGGDSVISLNQTSGSFNVGEQIQINGVDFPRTIGIVTAYTAQNIKSVSDTADFRADAVMEKLRLPNNILDVVIDGTSVTAPGNVFTGIKTGSVVRYTKPGFTTETYNRVASIGAGNTNLTLEAIGSFVEDVYEGTPPSGSIQSKMFIAAPIITGSGNLFAPLPNNNVSDIDLSNSTISITKQIAKDASAGQLTIADSDTGISDVVFETFDQERYSLFTTASGTPLPISNDVFSYASNQIVINDLANDNKTINVTLTKTKIRSKLKKYNRSQKLNVTRSKLEQSGSVSGGNGGSLADGLTFDRRYGLRVQDEEISFNYPDVVKFLAVYESTNTNAPELDKLVFTSTVNVSGNAVIGENIISQETNTVARVVSSPSSNILEVVYLTSGKFEEGESVKFEESNIKTTIESVIIGKYKNITNSFKLDKGQKEQYYDYSKLVRIKNVSEPSKQLLVIFDYYSVSSNDGDVFTVLSYDEERFSEDIPNIGERGIRATDTLDFRPRVSFYDPSSNTGSPFEFSARDFSGTEILRYITPNENSILDFKYYLPRIDKVYLNKLGDFVYEKGISSLDPKPSSKVGELMELATISLPPYLYNPQDAVFTLVDNRRYTMRDIGEIEDRVANLEETTSLSLLEISAQTLQIQDEEGRNRFKTGFFADPFKNYRFINRNLSSIQINPQSNELIPFRTRDTLASQITPATSVITEELDFNEDFELFDSNVKKTGNIVTLNYKEVEWITQPYATKTDDINDIINVNPYELPVFYGEVQLDPEDDVWTRTVQLADKTVRQTGTTEVRKSNFLIDARRETTINIPGLGKKTIAAVGGRGGQVYNFLFQTSNTETETENKLVATSNDDFIRSRNIQFIAEGFVDFVKTYVFFDGQRIYDIIPKLLEITPSKNGSTSGSNGSYKIGEEVHAVDPDGNVIGKFRICQPNHKSGKYDNPSETYFSNPYTKGLTEISSDYSQSSTVLNIDTKALSEEAQGKYFGYVTNNTQLIGQESGATSYVKNLKLVTDAYGDVIGSCFIRNPHSQPEPPVKVQTGVKEFKVTTSETNENVEPTQKFGLVNASSEYAAEGTVEEWQTTVTVTTNTTEFDVTVRRRRNKSRRRRHSDPLAQTFLVGGNVLAPSARDANKDLNGVFITAVEVYFATVDTVTNAPIRCEIRSTIADARPSMEVIGRSKTLKPKGTDANGNEVTLIEADPNEASKPTKFTFPEPIYLEPGKSYAFVLVAPRSVAYNVWTGRHGGIAVNPSTITGADPGASIIYSTQYGAGSIFKSQNGALWTEDQHQDMTFKLYKAEFTSESGSVFFNNPDLNESNGYEVGLIDNPIFTLAKTGSIGITTNKDVTINSLLVPGRKIGGNVSGTAVITGVGASAANPSILSGGTNYSSTPSDTNSVNTFAITGKGSGLTLDLNISNGVITGATEVGGGGNGYQAGDVVGIVTSSAGNQGTGAQITIGFTPGINTLYLTNIQADNSVNGFRDGDAIKYFDDAGTAVSMGSTGTILTGGVNFDGGAHEGNVAFINQFNHGMYSNSNRVKFSGIESNVEPTTLSSELSKTETAVISVGSTSQFVNFEGIAVGSANTGYVKIGSEIIGYESVGTGVLNIGNSQRGVDNTIIIDHAKNSIVTKHEIDGVSIRRLEVIDPAGLSVSDPIDIDTYHVTFDRSTNGTNRQNSTPTVPQLSFNTESFLGGSNVKASQNILYGALVPRYDVLTPTGIDGAETGITASIRTVTGTSVSGNEISFIDNGFEDVRLNRINSFNTIRMVASKLNENQYLTGLPSNKSFTTILNLTTNDKNISPVVRLTSGSETEFINHRLNRPINLENYDTDNKVNSILEDEHASIYISNLVLLNKPATSLKVILDAFRPQSADFRVLYNIIKSDSSEVEQTFELFPGFKNSTKTDNDGFIVNDESKNDGRPDIKVTASESNEFKEYQFTADNLPEFIGFVIKIVMTGTNQATPPRLKDLRAIAVR